MNELALHILDLAENSVAAGASRVDIRIALSHDDDRLTIEMQDDGRGMSAEFLQRAADPFATTRTERKVGLGLSLVRQLCEMCDGAFRIESEPGRGTLLHLEFRLSHVDLPPMGDLAQTMLALVILYSDRPDFRLTYSEGSAPYVFDTAEIRKLLGEVPLNTPQVVRWIKDDLREGLYTAARPRTNNFGGANHYEVCS